MITDHGVRTLLEQRMSKAINLAAAGNYESAINMYENVISMAYSLDGYDFIERAKEGIARCEEEMSCNL